MTIGGRGVAGAIAALVLSAFVTVAPVSGATVGAVWRAGVGPGGTNGTATIRIDTSGAGTLSVSLKRLARATIYSETLYRGTCSKPGARLAALPSIKTTSSGTFARTNTLTTAQASVVNDGGVVIRLVAGSRLACGALVAQAGANLVTTCDQAHLAAAVARGGTARFACDATITLTSTIQVTKPVVLDATDRSVVVDGEGAVGLFSVTGGAAFGVVGLTLQGGSSSGAGGAIDASLAGPVTITSSTFAGNTALTGGAITAGANAPVTILGSTFVNNSASGGNGGAISGPTVSATDSTFSGNQAALGGAIHALSGLSIVNSTFVDNIATGASFALDGGTATVQSSILAGQMGDECALGASSMSDAGGNFSTDGSCGLTAASSQNSVALAALNLGALADNGGPTQTIALLTGSLAVDAGIGCPPPATDQRGVPRPQGAACDSGAFEVEPPAGYDISFPQCGDPLPAAPVFAIVGVNGGRAFTRNPCLGAGVLPSELAWAGGTGAQLYANTGNPGPTLSTHWPSGQASPRQCDTATAPGADTADCAYDYGWNAAADSYQAAVDAYVSLGLAPQGATQTPIANAWWLDVETSNSWRGDVALNVAALQGEVDYLRSVGVASIGIYSTAYQWNKLTGGTQVFAPAPSWVAGARTSVRARASCGAIGFTGGPVVLVQYPANGLDADLRC
jgi:predicted outer membrane repeat protein